MTYVDLRPDDVRPVRVLVSGVWWVGDLEAYRQDADGAWHGYVRWSEGLGATRLGWFGEHELASVGGTEAPSPTVVKGSTGTYSSPSGAGHSMVAVVPLGESIVAWWEPS